MTTFKQADLVHVDECGGFIARDDDESEFSIVIVKTSALTKRELAAEPEGEE